MVQSMYSAGATLRPLTRQAGESWCSIFCDRLPSLYRIARVVTGSAIQAEKCLLSALEFCSNTRRQPSFQDAREAVARIAVRLSRKHRVLRSGPLEAALGSLSWAERTAFVLIFLVGLKKSELPSFSGIPRVGCEALIISALLKLGGLPRLLEREEPSHTATPLTTGAMGLTTRS